jgi:outer membrane protein
MQVLVHATFRCHFAHGQGSSRGRDRVRRQRGTGGAVTDRGRRAKFVSKLVWATLVLRTACALAQTRVLTLDEASQAALASHETIRAAAAEERRAAVAGDRALSAYGPTIQQTGSYTRNKNGISFAPTPGQPENSSVNPVILQREATRGTLSISQPLYTHQFWALRSLGEHEAERTREGSRLAREEVIAAVIQAYYDLLRAHALTSVAEEAVRLADVEVSHAEARVKVGEAVRSEVIRAQAETARAAQQVVESDGAAEIAADRLSRLTGIPRSFDVVEPTGRSLDLSSADPYVALSRERNPELQQAEAALASARDEERRRWAALLPTLGFQFNYHLVDHEAFAEQNNFWDFLFAVQVPILDAGGARLLDWNEQRALVSRIEAEVAGLRRDVELGVRQAWVNARTLAAQEEAAQKQVSLATETYRLLSEQYTVGVATGLDVLDALSARNSARANLTVVHYSRAVAGSSLERAAGILGEEEGAVQGAKR